MDFLLTVLILSEELIWTRSLCTLPTPLDDSFTGPSSAILLERQLARPVDASVLPPFPRAPSSASISDPAVWTLCINSAQSKTPGRVLQPHPLWL